MSALFTQAMLRTGHRGQDRSRQPWLPCAAMNLRRADQLIG